MHKISSKRIFQFYFRYINKTNKGVVITFHRVTASSDKSDGLNNFIEISQNNFEKVLINLKKLNSKFVLLSGLEECLAEKDNIRPIVHISFDDGYEDNYSIAFPILKKYNIPFSIFISSDFIDNEQPFLWWYILEYIIENKIVVSLEKYEFEITKSDYKMYPGAEIFQKFRKLVLENADADLAYFKAKLLGYINQDDSFMPSMLKWSQVNEMLNSGLCEIGVHTQTHARFSNLTDDEKLNEIKVCKNEIKKHTGIDAKYFAYPYGSLADIGSFDSLKIIMQSCDIQLAFTTHSSELNASVNKYLIPRVFINNTATMYTLKTRLDGSYQRNLS